MITEYSGLPENVIGVSATGEVTKDDYEEVLIPLIEDKLKDHKKVSLFYYIGPQFTGFTAGAMWDDTKVGLKHIADWDKVAMVTDVPWLRNTVKCFAFIMPGKLKVFSNDQRSDAEAWIQAAA